MATSFTREVFEEGSAIRTLIPASRICWVSLARWDGEGGTPGVPPAPSALAALPARMRDAGIGLLIAEPYSSESVVRQIASRSGARAVTLITSVGADPAASDYVALFDVNVRRLTTALAGAR